VKTEYEVLAALVAAHDDLINAPTDRGMERFAAALTAARARVKAGAMSKEEAMVLQSIGNPILAATKESAK